MMKLDKAGTYLRYFGRKQDTVYIRTLLISTKLRWKKLIRHMDERGRLLTQAYREDKRVSLKPAAAAGWPCRSRILLYRVLFETVIF